MSAPAATQAEPAAGALSDIPVWAEDGRRLTWTDLPVDGWVGDLLADLDLEDCSDQALLDVATMWDRLASWVTGNQAKVIARFAALRPPPDSEPDPGSGRYVFPEPGDDLDPELDDSAVDELSVALNVPAITAQRRLDAARNLVRRLPGTLDHLCRGQVSTAHAQVLADQSAQLDADQTAELERRVLPGAGERTPGQFRDRVRREITRIDAEALRRRAVRAKDLRKVVLIPQTDGMAILSCELPGPDAVAAYNWLDQHARTAKSAGDDRSLDQLRADAFIDLVRQRSTAVAIRPLIRVLVPATTLAGGNAPAELAGFGPIDPDLARELAADGSWQRLLTDPRTGTVTEIGGGRYVPPAALRSYVETRDRTCRFPTCNQPAHRCDVDHTVRYGASRRTVPDNLGALCRRHHRLKDQPGSRWRLEQSEPGEFVWTTPTGRKLVVTADPPVDQGTGRTESRDAAGADRRDADVHGPSEAERESRRRAEADDPPF